MPTLRTGRKGRSGRGGRGSTATLTPQQYNAQRLATLATQPQKRVRMPPASKLIIARYARELTPIADQAYAIANRTVIRAVEAQQAIADAEGIADAMTTRQKIKAFLAGRRSATKAIRAAAQNVPHSPEQKEALDLPPDVKRAIADMEAQIAKMVAALGNPAFQIAPAVEAAAATANEAAMTSLGLKVIDPGTKLAALEQRWLEQNASLIKSIPREVADQVRQKVATMVPQGARWETIAKELRAEHGIAKRRAELIARDQVGKYNSALAQTRMQACGIAAYSWSGAQDNRERASHLALQGSVWTWDKPPPIGPPGSQIRCRCVSVPITSNDLAKNASTLTPEQLQARMVAIGPRDDDPPDITREQLEKRSARELKGEIRLQAEFVKSRMV